MQPQYYYLVASLVDISLDLNKLPIEIDEFFNICLEEMNKKDFDDLKKLFIFNDIQNSIKYKDNSFVFIKPSSEIKEFKIETKTIFVEKK